MEKEIVKIEGIDVEIEATAICRVSSFVGKNGL